MFRWVKANGGLAGRLPRIRPRRICFTTLSTPAILRTGRSSRSKRHERTLTSDAAFDADFLAQAEARGMFNLKGHRSVGGMRASIYNAVSMESVQTLVTFMSEFENERG